MARADIARMPPASSPISSDLSHRAQRRSPTRQILWDLGGVALLAIVALTLGLVMNRYSSSPLPIVYQNPEQRFDAELTTLVTAPPLKIAPAATVALGQFRSAVDSKSALILDARPSAFFERGHVPGALNLSRDNFARDYHELSAVLKGVGDKPIIVYCSGGDCHDSRMVANALLSLGFGDVSVFTGGWEAWSGAGLPESTGSAP